MNNKKIVYYSIVKKTDIDIDNIVNKLETDQAINVLKKQLNYFNLELPEIYILSNGKPYFKKSDLFFNYSHSKNYIACAIAFHEVGIDIEETSRKINDDIANKYLDNVIGNEKRIEMWVKKESYSKLKGLGIQIMLQDVKISEITTKNLFISKKEYMCSIYCDRDDVEFRELNFNRIEY